MINSYETRYFNHISREFQSVDLGDKRLSKRLMSLAESVASNPTESFPKLLGGGAGIEGGYRFLRNPKVSFEKILRPHIDETVLRAELEGTALVLHDTTEFKFSSEREGLGWLHKSKGKCNGFFAHFSLVVSPLNSRPLGVIAAEISINTGAKKGYQSPAKRKADKSRKSLRWMRGVQIAEQNLGPNVQAIHVADREADFFEYFSELKDFSSRHVTRVCRDRLIFDEQIEEGISLFRKLESSLVKLQREVRVSSRAVSPLPKKRDVHPARQERLAILSISATEVELKRTHHNDKTLNDGISLNVVHVFESHPPEGQEAIDWKLFTTEPIDKIEEIGNIVDYYRMRWLIEEYNKALKTGCSFEERQLESKKTLLNALAVFIPVAWRMLLLRSETRRRPDASALIALTPTQIDVLKAVSKISLSETPTVSEAMNAVAAMGGHLKQNGPPGWQILTKGFTELLTLEKGWLAFKRCDQS